MSRLDQILPVVALCVALGVVFTLVILALVPSVLSVTFTVVVVTVVNVVVVVIIIVVVGFAKALGVGHVVWVLLF